MAIQFLTVNWDKPRRLRFGMGAMVEYEQITGEKLSALNQDLSYDTCAKILWVMLKQDDNDLTLKDVCNLVDEYGDNISDVIDLVTTAIELALEQKNVPNALKPMKSKK